MAADNNTGEENGIKVTPEIGARLRDRRLQFGMTLKEVAGVIDLEGADMEAIEAGKRSLSAAELRGLRSYLCISDEYPAGEQNLEELVQSDEAETEQMITSIAKAFRKLPNEFC